MLILFLSSFCTKMKKTDMNDGDNTELNNAFVIINPSLEDIENISVHSIKLTYENSKKQSE